MTSLLVWLVSVFVIVITSIVLVGVHLYGRYVRIIHKRKDFRPIADKETLLQNGFSAKKIEALGSFDVVIIGSGMGGLTSGALLSRCGYRVLVLEQHDILGGCTHTFTEKGYEFDTGVHYLGADVTSKRSPIGFLFHLLSGGELKWSKLSDVYDKTAISPALSKQRFPDGYACPTSSITSMSFSEDEEVTVRRLEELFPSEREAIRSFFRLTRWAEILFPIYLTIKLLPLYLYRIIRFCTSFVFAPFVGSTTLECLTTNKELIGILTWCWGDMGLPPSQSAFLMTGLLVTHFSRGAYYPTNGSSSFAASFVSTILAHGGAALVRAPVSHIILSSDGKRAEGVHVRGVDIKANIIISAAGALNTFLKLIPATAPCSHAQKVRDMMTVYPTSSSPIDSLVPSCTMMTVFVGFSVSPEQLQLPATNLWLYPHWNHDLGIEQYNKALAHDDGCDFLPLLFISSASAKDSSWSRRYPNRAVAELITVADYASFVKRDPKHGEGKPKHRGGRYEDLKQHLQDKVMEVFTDYFPQVKGKIDYVTSGTPLSNNFYLGSVNGEVYGLAHTPARFTTYDEMLRPATPIEGLYLSGQDVTCGGIVGAVFGGVMAATSVSLYSVLDTAFAYVMEMTEAK